MQVIDSDEPERYRIGGVVLDAGRQQVLWGNNAVDLPKLSFKLLLQLVRSAPNVVSTDDLLEHAWDGALVNPETVSKRVTLVREAIASSGYESEVIGTVRGTGYRIVVPVQLLAEQAKRGVAAKGGNGVHLSRRWIGGLSIAAATAIVAFLMLGDELTQWRTEEPIAPGAPVPIAVMAFTDLSPSSEYEYFSEGFATELIRLLTQVDGLNVKSSTSSFQFSDTELDIPAIADRLGVTHILEGSVRWADNRVRITAQLIDVRSDTSLWAETFEREFEGIFAIEDEVAASVIDALKLTMDIEVPTAVRHDPEAYPLYIQAKHLIALNDPTELATAEALLGRVLEIEPGYIDAMMDQALLYLRFARKAALAGQFESSDEYAARREKVLAGVSQIAPDNPVLNSVLGWDAMAFERDFVKAASHIEQALAAAPRDYSTLLAGMALVSDLGRTELAVRIGEYLTNRNPLGFWSHSNLADNYLLSGQTNQAIRSYRTAASLTPQAERIWWKLGIAVLMSGNAEDALEYFEKEKIERFKLHGQALALHALGDVEGSLSAIDVLLETGEDEAWPFGFARLYAWIGHADFAFEYLYHTRDSQPFDLVGEMSSPFFLNLHEDPRWEPLIDEVSALTADIEFNPKLPPEIGLP